MLRRPSLDLPTAKRSADSLSPACALLGRLLLFLTALQLAVMPVTEHLWTFDGFLRGGQDFELGVLSLISILCLALLVAQQRRQDVNLLFTLRQWLSLFTRLTDIRTDRTGTSFHALSRLTAPACRPHLYTPPLLI